jgi:hypothetical protein
MVESVENESFCAERISCFRKHIYKKKRGSLLGTASFLKLYNYGLDFKNTSKSDYFLKKEKILRSTVVSTICSFDILHIDVTSF